MQVDDRAEVNEQETQERVNVYMPSKLRERLKKAAAIRGTSESATAVKGIKRWLEWFENLSGDEREAV